MRREYAVQSDEPASWAVVNTHPHRERLAISNLERQDFQAYCPVVRTQVRHARQIRETLRPLFPGYVFVRMRPQLQRWRPLLSTIGVKAVVRFGDSLGLLDDGFVQALRRSEIDGAVVRPKTRFKIGDQIELTAGPLEGLVATIIDLDEKDRLIVLLDILGRPVKARVNATSVKSRTSEVHN